MVFTQHPNAGRATLATLKVLTAVVMGLLSMYKTLSFKNSSSEHQEENLDSD